MFKLIKNAILNFATCGENGSAISEKIRKFIVINVFTTLGFVCSLIFSIVSFQHGNKPLGFVLIVIIFVCLFTWTHLRVTKKHTFGAYAITVSMFLLNLYLIITGGANGTGPLWYYVLPPISTFMLNKNKGIFFNLLLLLAAIFVFYFGPEWVYQYNQDFKARFIASFIVLLAMTYIYESVRESMSKILLKSNSEKSEYIEEISTQAELLVKTNIELEKLSLVAKETDNAIAMSDKDGNIEWINEGFKRLFGYNLNEFIELKGKNLIEASSNPNIKSEIATCIGSKKPVTYSSKTETKEGKVIWVQTTLSPVLDKENNLTKIVSIDSDISLLKIAEEEINQKTEEILSQRDQLFYALNQLKVLEEFKDAQAAMIVHDLKNPLNFILNFSSNLPSEQGNKLIRQAARQSLNLVLNILDIQKYEKAEMKLELSPCNVYNMSVLALQDIEVFIDDKSILIENSIPKELMINVDQDIIVRVFMNLITNAVKYSPNGGKLVFTAEKSDLFIKIGIKDNGEGISKELQDSVFEKFSQVKAKSIGAARSTGLGLTFCKLAVESHGGKIWIDSEIGQGATFYFTLPICDDIETPEEVIVDKNIIEFSDSDILLLRNYISEIETMDIYETSKNLLLVEKIKSMSDTAGVSYFKTELENAILNFNEVKITHLLNRIK